MIDIPQGDERQMFQLAESYGQATDGLAKYLQQVAQMGNPIIESWGGDAAMAFQEQWTGYVEEITNAIGSLADLQDMAQNAGIELETAKYMAAINFWMLAQAIWSALASAFFTAGISTAEVPVAMGAAKIGISTANRQLLIKLIAKKFVSKLADFRRFLNPKNLLGLAKDGGRWAAHHAGDGLKYARDRGLKGVVEDAGKGAAKGAWNAGKDGLKGLGDRLAARGAADRAATEWAGQNLKGSVLGNLVRGNLKGAAGKLAGKGAERATTQAVRHAAYREALGAARQQGMGKVWATVGRDTLAAARGRAIGFASFQLKTTLGISAIQAIEGHHPHPDLMSVLPGMAIGALGGPLSVGLGHGMIGEMASMAGGTAAVGRIRTAFGQHGEWRKEVGSSP